MRFDRLVRLTLVSLDVAPAQPRLPPALRRREGRGGGPAINGQQFIRTPLRVRYYVQPDDASLWVLDAGITRGPSTGGTLWTIRHADARLAPAGMTGVDADGNPVYKRYCRWGGADATEAEPPAAGDDPATVITCASAAKARDFAGEVAVAVSLNGVDYSDTGLTFTYYRAPEVSEYAPHGGPVKCTEAATNHDGTSAVADGQWNTNDLDKPPVAACPLVRNWQPAPTPRVIKALAHGYSKRLETMSGDEILSEESTWYGSGDTISLVFEGRPPRG